MLGTAVMVCATIYHTVCGMLCYGIWCGKLYAMVLLMVWYVVWYNICDSM